MELQKSPNHEQHFHQKDPNAEARIKKESKSIFGFFIINTRVTVLLLIAIVIFGSLALINIPRESDPEVKIPIAIVTTVFPGASPADVENLVTNEVENKIEELDNIKLVTSNSTQGISSVVVEFEAEANLKDSIRNLKDKVLEIRGLPDDAENPFVTEVRANDLPIITFSLAGPLNDAEFKNLGEFLQDELEKISGVSEVPLLGTKAREFSVTVNKASLNQAGISFNQVVGAVASANSDTPLGDITIDKTNYSLRTVAKIKNLEDLKRTPVATVNGQTILLEDVAVVTDGFADQKNISRLSIDGQAPIQTISLQILKRTGGNILNIVDEAKVKLDEFKKDGTIPAEVQVEVSSDYSKFIRDDLRTLGSSGVSSVILIFVILLVALTLREATISLLSIPLSFLITFFVLNSRGDTLNGLTLFSLVLSLGLLVDSFIVILEGIFYNIRQGYTSKEASLLAVSHYKKPLLSGALTTIAAFIPMLLVSGILGEYLKVLPITLSTVLFSSLFVSLAIVPAMAAVILNKKGYSKTDPEKPKESVLEKYLTNRLGQWYSVMIEQFLADKKKKIKFLAVVVLAFVASLGFLISPIIKVELFPVVDIDFTMIDIEMPIGTELAETEKVVAQVENYLLTRDDIKVFATTIGRGSAGFSFGSSAAASENIGNINITFIDAKHRDKKSYEINDEMRKDLASIAQGKITVTEITSGPPTGAPIEARITGPDLAVIDQLAVDLESILKATPGVIDIEADREVSPADITFTLRKDALSEAGLSVGEVSGFLRGAIFGITATEININGDDVNVVVKLNESHIDSIEKVKNLSISNSRGQSVVLSRVADFSLEPALAAIRHRNFERTATVRANLEPGFVASKVVPEVEKQIKAKVIPQGYAYNFGGEVEDIEKSFSELWNAMIVAVLLILFILVVQFDSFKKPLIILLTLPLTLIGVVVGMLIFHMAFSFSVFLGIISLAGIAVNDAIVLIDKADRNVKEFKMKPRQAIADAGLSRMQPIMLTSITTVVGILPLAFADEFWFGLSISIMFGITFATVLQLFVIPIVYLKLEGKRVLREISK